MCTLAWLAPSDSKSLLDFVDRLASGSKLKLQCGEPVLNSVMCRPGVPRPGGPLGLTHRTCPLQWVCNLYAAERKIYSQNGEDGVIAKLARASRPLPACTCLEVYTDEVVPSLDCVPGV